TINIRDHPLRHIGRDPAAQLEAFLMSADGERLHDSIQRRCQIDFDRRDQQFAGFDLREVKDIVDDAEQRICGAFTELRYSFCSRVNSVSSASSVMPMMPFMGVRISWLMLARNSLLARLAVWAASLNEASVSSCWRM